MITVNVPDGCDAAFYFPGRMNPVLSRREGDRAVIDISEAEFRSLLGSPKGVLWGDANPEIHRVFAVGDMLNSGVGVR